MGGTQSRLARLREIRTPDIWTHNQVASVSFRLQTERKEVYFKSLPNRLSGESNEIN